MISQGTYPLILAEVKMESVLINFNDALLTYRYSGRNITNIRHNRGTYILVQEKLSECCQISY